MTPKYILKTDGGARGNPGPAAAGAVLFANDKIIDQASSYLGSTTNNQAEYQALLLGLRLARSHSITQLTVMMDSELIIKQMRGEYKVKHPDMKPLHQNAIEQTKDIQVTWQHIPRSQNSQADRLVNQVLDEL